MIAIDEYSHSKRRNILLPIQMQLPEKLKTISQIFISFLESTLNFKHFEKKELHSSGISEVIDYEQSAYLNA